eukprot:11334174-Karenia_brevis.AAC.1
MAATGQLMSAGSRTHAAGVSAIFSPRLSLRLVLPANNLVRRGPRREQVIGQFVARNNLDRA